MTKTEFIKKWLVDGDKINNTTRENMLSDLDEVINLEIKILKKTKYIKLKLKKKENNNYY